MTRVRGPPLPLAGSRQRGPRARALDALRDLAQRQLPQVGQVLLLEEVFERPGDLVGGVDLPGAQSLLQIFDRQIEVHDLVGLAEKTVWNRLAHGHACRALDDVVQALQVLHVDGADDVDAGIQQLERVLVALAISATGDVRVRQLVDQRDGGIALQDVVEAHLLDAHPPVFDRAARDDLEPGHQRLGVLAPV